MKLIVGLGNPGELYLRTRHNIGFRCVDLLSEKHKIPLSSFGEGALFGRGRIRGEEVILAKPQTFMNSSGRAVKGLLARFALSPSDLLVIYDDVDLPIGQLRIRKRGGSGGHKGLESLISSLGTEEFPRLRIGIRPPGKESRGLRRPEFVLSPFSPDEEELMEIVIHKAAEAVECFLEEGAEAAMNKFNAIKIC